MCWVALFAVGLVVPGLSRASAYEDIKRGADFATIVYIDPAAPVAGDGSSPEAPLASWSAVTFAADTAYLQMRGTTDTLGATLAVNADDVLLGAYGSEDLARPIIYTTVSGGHAVDCQGARITVRDLEIASPSATSGIRFATWNNADDGTVWNCDVHGIDSDHYLGWGIRIMGWDDRVQNRCRVLYTTVQYTGDDGFFIQNARNVEIGHCHITRVNQGWFTNTSSGGDSIQFDRDITGFHVHHCYADRTDTGNKQVFIANPSVADVQGFVEFNHFRINGDRAALFCGSGTNYAPVIRGNLIENTDAVNGGSGIYLHADLPQVYNNVLRGHARGISLISPLVAAEIHHNVFTDILWNAIYGSRSFTAHNNIFDCDPPFHIIESSAAYSASNNLFVAAQSAQGTDPVVGQPAFRDPAGDDFRLKGSSDAINAGIFLAGVERDADGRPRIGRPDLGAYEYAGASLAVLPLMLLAD